MDIPDAGFETEEAEYRDRVAHRRWISAAFLLFLFAGVPGIAFLLMEAFF